MIKKLLLLVLVGLGVGMAVPASRARMLEAVAPLRDNINARMVPSRLRAMADQMDVRLQRAEGFPQRFDSWLRRDYSGVPEDPWGNQYYLQTARSSYTVGSMGPDGEQGTQDDITETRDIPRGR